jgi:two-component system sensor histidine kinase TctE
VSSVFDQWLFDSASTLATQIKDLTDRTRLDLPQSAVEMFEFDAVDPGVLRRDHREGNRIFGNSPLPFPPISPSAGRRFSTTPR